MQKNFLNRAENKASMSSETPKIVENLYRKHCSFSMFHCLSSRVRLKFYRLRYHIWKQNIVLNKF